MMDDGEDDENEGRICASMLHSNQYVYMSGDPK